MRVFILFILLPIGIATFSCDTPYATTQENPDISYNVYFRENGREKLEKYLKILNTTETRFQENYDESGELTGSLHLIIRKSVYLENKPEDRLESIADKLSQVIVESLHNIEDYDSLRIEMTEIKGKPEEIFSFSYDLSEVYAQSYPDYPQEEMSVEQHYTLARQAAAELNYPQALIHLEVLMDEDPEYIPALELKANIYVLQQEYLSAVFQYAELITLDSMNVFYHIESGKANIELGYFEDARKDINRAIRVSGSPQAEHLFLRGKISFMEDDFTTAQTEFDQTLSLDPHFAEAYYYRGLIFVENSRRFEACQDFQMAREKGVYSEDLEKELSRCRILDLLPQ
ncbi:MAG: hypothetical protein SF052_06910 [Bacteroidia bacterium]|nr:hypothetical protein [Bacteroidia bacterium]